MAMELRETGISVVGDVPWGTHFCYFYETVQDLLDTLVPYFMTGLKNKELCLWIVSNSEMVTPEEAKEALAQALPEFERYVAEGSIEIVTHDEWFHKNGEAFDLQRVANQFTRKLDEALARGYAGVRVNGSPAWLQKEDRKRFCEFEEQLDNLFPNQRIIASCTYPLACTGYEIFDVTQRHQFAIAKRCGQWEVIETPELKLAKAEIKRLNEDLEERVFERTKELRAANDELSKEITERKRAEDKLKQTVTELIRAEEQLKATSEQLRALSARLESAREEEGTRIAREIHDELGAALSSLRWDLEDVDETVSEVGDRSQLHDLRKKIGEMMRLIDTTINTVRKIAAELRPTILDDLGLAAAIEWQAQQFQARTGIVCSCDCSLEKVESEQQSTAVFRIFQEALTNVLRHAQATRVDIKMNEENGYFNLSISDNGKGISENEKSKQQSLGILGMRERAHLIGGEIDINGVEGKGTVVIVRVPISGEDTHLTR